MLAPNLELMMPLSDDELIERIVGGDTPVFELLMRRHNQRLYRLARSVVRSDDQAEEVLQETYLRAYANLAQFEGRSSVATWLSRIAFHEALRHKRRARRARTAEGFDLDSLQMNDTSSEGVNPLVREELRASLKNALDALPTSMRAIVTLRLVEGLSTRETAESLRLTQASVKVGLHRARRLLSDLIEEQAIPQLREELTFGNERCDRMVRKVFARLTARLPWQV